MLTYTYTCAKSEKPRPKYSCEKVPTIQDKEIQSTCLRSWLQLTTSRHPSGLSSTSILATKQKHQKQSLPRKSLLIKNLVKSEFYPTPQALGRFTLRPILSRLSRLHHWALRPGEVPCPTNSRSDKKKSVTCTRLVPDLCFVRKLWDQSSFQPHCSTSSLSTYGSLILPFDNITKHPPKYYTTIWLKTQNSHRNLLALKASDLPRCYCKLEGSHIMVFSLDSRPCQCIL